MYKAEIIEAIQNQMMLKIVFRKIDDSVVTRDIAPYDVYPQENKKTHLTRDILAGWAKRDLQKEEHQARVYLDTIQSMTLLNEPFNGPKIRRLMEVREQPKVQRNW